MVKLSTKKINTTKLTVRKAQDELITSCSVTKYRRACKNDGDLSRGHRSQLEGACTGQICDHMSNKLRKIINYKPTGRKGIHESVLIMEKGEVGSCLLGCQLSKGKRGRLELESHLSKSRFRRNLDVC